MRQRLKGGGVQAAKNRHVVIQSSLFTRNRNANVGPPKRGSGVVECLNVGSSYLESIAIHLLQEKGMPMESGPRFALE